MEESQEMKERLRYRRSGRTTRIVDSAIQDLFNKGFCILSDHHRGTNQYTRYILEHFIRRFELEHGDPKKLLDIGNIKNESVRIDYLWFEE